MTRGVFKVGSELCEFIGRPIRDALGAATVNLSLTYSLTWKTQNDIEFPLTPTAACRARIESSSASFPVAMTIESTQMTDLVAHTY